MIPHLGKVCHLTDLILWVLFILLVVKKNHAELLVFCIVRLTLSVKHFLNLGYFLSDDASSDAGLWRGCALSDCWPLCREGLS